MVLDIIKGDIDKLNQAAPLFDFANPPTDPIQLAKDLVETMVKNQGLGLAANQVGLPYRVFVILSNPHYVMFNPWLINASAQKIILDESCLSFPGLILKIERPQVIRIRFTCPNGEVMTKQFSGLTSRVIQHENEHIDGKFFFSNVSRVKLERAIKAAKRRGINYEGAGLLRFVK